MEKITEKQLREYWPDITKSFSKLPLFPNQKKAKAFAKTIGWPANDIFRIERRFETIYLVAHKHFRTSLEGGIDIETIRIPLGIYDNNNNMQVITIRKPAKRR